MTGFLVRRVRREVGANKDCAMTKLICVQSDSNRHEFLNSASMRCPILDAHDLHGLRRRDREFHVLPPSRKSVARRLHPGYLNTCPRGGRRERNRGRNC
jgi:hypothetical protein